MKDLLIHEKALWNDYPVIAGVDEVGRGCLAGPVVAGAVILPNDSEILKKLEQVNDSKLLSEKKRKDLFKIIQENALDYSVGIVSANVIDQINILQATFLAMRRSLKFLELRPDYVLVDGDKRIPSMNIKQQTIIKGDSNSLSIAAASIIAKVTRDEIMVALDEYYQEYNFPKHKGYATKIHREAIQKAGLSNLHRVSFCKNIVIDKKEVQLSLLDV